MDFTEWLGLFGHFLVLSLIAVGGAITTVPDMHRYLVVEHGWLDDAQFTASIALAQAAPGPNVLFVAVLGWNAAGAWGAFATLTGIVLPSTLLTLHATRWSRARRDTRAVRAIAAGLTPLTLGLLAATGWVLAEPYVRTAADDLHRLGAVALVGVVVWAMVRTKIGPMALVALGAVVGAFGGV
jgi:chromate transporter